MQRKARIKVEKLTYHYGSGQPVLKNISPLKQARQMYCLHGQNGAGKTTLAKTLQRPAQPSSGTRFTLTVLIQLQ